MRPDAAVYTVPFFTLFKHRLAEKAAKPVQSLSFKWVSLRHKMRNKLLPYK
jgi:hypothetical protein